MHTIALLSAYGVHRRFQRALNSLNSIVPRFSGILHLARLATASSAVFSSTVNRRILCIFPIHHCLRFKPFQEVRGSVEPMGSAWQILPDPALVRTAYVGSEWGMAPYIVLSVALAESWNNTKNFTLRSWRFRQVMSPGSA